MTALRIGSFLERLVDSRTVTDGVGAVAMALRLLAPELPAGIVGTAGISTDVPSVAVAAPDGERLAAFPIEGLIRRVIEAGQAVRVCDGSRDLYLSDSPALSARLLEAACDEAFLAPLRDYGQVIGALVFASRERLEASEVALLEQAANALSLVLRSTDRTEPTDRERRVSEIRRAHAQALDGAPLTDVLEAVASSLDADIELAEGGSAHVRELGHTRTGSSEIVPIEAAGHALGTMVVRTRGGRVPRALVAEAAATVRSALLVQRMRRSEDDRPLRSLAEELLGTLDVGWTMRGSRPDYDLDVPLTALLVGRDAGGGTGAATDEELVALVGGALGARATRTFVAVRPGEVLALLARRTEDEALGLAARIIDSAREFGAAKSVSCFISETGYTSDRIYAQVHQLERLRRLYLSLGRRGAVISTPRAGIDGLLLESGNREHMTGWRNDLLQPLLDYDRDHGGLLIPTLDSFLAQWCHLQRCADALHVHLNTLKYRLRRIQDVLELDLHDPAVRGDLLFACHVHRALLALEGTPEPPPAPWAGPDHGIGAVVRIDHAARRNVGQGGRGPEGTTRVSA